MSNIFDQATVRKVSLGFVLGGILMAASLVHAQTFSEQAALKSNPKVIQKAWNLPVVLETSSSMHSSNSYERQAMTSLTLAPSYKISEAVKLFGSTLFYKEETGAGDSGMDNTRLGLALSKKLSKQTLWSNTISVVVPTNKILRDETSYQGAVRGATGVSWSKLPMDSVLSYNLSYTRNFHEYDLTAGGSFNVRETVAQTLEYSLPVVSKLSLLTSFSYSYGLTYEDDSRSKFYVGADLSWAFNQALSMSVGTSNEGNALKPNGSDSNIEFYNDNSSVVKMGLVYVL